MVFSSLAFLCVFLPAVLIVDRVLPSIRLKNALLIVASLLFYAFGEPVYVLLMLGSTICNWLFARLMENRDGRARTAWLVAAVAVNLGLLVVFKYSGMLVGTVGALTGLQLPVPQIALPIGISFYTFQALSYVIDVYRRDVHAQRNYARVLLYVSFFPQLIAGPIVKYHDIDVELGQRHATAIDTAQGLRRFCVGLGKKVLIANTLGLAADHLFALDPGVLGLGGAWLAALCYLLQIYYDFSGYSDMAIGLGRMFGFHFKENFDHPYASKSIKEFWRKWHISLSTWFRDYLYIPMGGNRKGTARTYINKIVVFFLCGLWHGASWTFVLWGLYQGLFLLFEGLVPVHKLPRWLGHVYAILVVMVGFVIFRCDTLAQAGTIIASLFGAGGLAVAPQVLGELSPLLIAVLVVGFVGSFPLKPVLSRLLSRTPVQGQGAGAGLQQSQRDAAANPDVSTQLAQGQDAGAGLQQTQQGSAANPGASTQPAQQRTVSNGVVYATYVGALVLLVLCVLSLSSGAYNPFIYFRF